MKANKKVTDSSSAKSENTVQTNQRVKKTKIEKISTFLDDIIKVYPKLKDDKQLIINKLTENNTSDDEYVLDKIVLPEGDYSQDDFNVLTENTQIYYIDPFDNILNAQNELVGVFNRLDIAGKYLFFKAKSILPDTYTVKYP